MRDSMLSRGRVRLPDGTLVFDDGTVAFRWEGDLFVAKARELSPTQIEVSAKREVYWAEGTIDDLTDRQLVYLRAVREGRVPERTDAEQAEYEALKARVSANRAKTRIRHLCKVINADAMLTLTYRFNQTDLALCKKHLREFVRRMYRISPGFRAVAGFEQQARGAWHVHLACPSKVLAVGKSEHGHVVKSYDVIRAVWRSVVGDLGGNVDVSKRFRSVRSSCARIAAYISKYITKAFAHGEKWSNRWTKFGEASVPPPIELGKVACMRQFIVDAYDLVGSAAEIAGCILSSHKDWFFLAAELPRRSSRLVQTGGV